MASPHMGMLILLLSLTLSTATLRAQQTPPSGWRWTTDTTVLFAPRAAPPEGALRFVEMAPGWHVTTGPGSLLIQDGVDLSGRYTVESEIFLFPGTSQSEYGVFLGGRDLESPERSYVAFVLRRDGAAAVIHRMGAQVEPLVVWTHEIFALGSVTEVMKNHIRVAVDSTGADFFVNDSLVTRVPLSRGAVEGRIGFRVGQGVNLHASTLDVTVHLAPVPARKPEGT